MPDESLFPKELPEVGSFQLHSFVIHILHLTPVYMESDVGIFFKDLTVTPLKSSIIQLYNVLPVCYRAYCSQSCVSLLMKYFVIESVTERVT